MGVDFMGAMGDLKFIGCVGHKWIFTLRLNANLTRKIGPLLINAVENVKYSRNCLTNHNSLYGYV